MKAMPIELSFREYVFVFWEFLWNLRVPVEKIRKFQHFDAKETQLDSKNVCRWAVIVIS